MGDSNLGPIIPVHNSLPGKKGSKKMSEFKQMRGYVGISVSAMARCVSETFGVFRNLKDQSIVKGLFHTLQ